MHIHIIGRVVVFFVFHTYIYIFILRHDTCHELARMQGDTRTPFLVTAHALDLNTEPLSFVIAGLTSNRRVCSGNGIVLSFVSPAVKATQKPYMNRQVLPKPMSLHVLHEP